MTENIEQTVEPTNPADELAKRDATIEALRAELESIKATPEGHAGEMAKALAALAAEVERMKAGQGLVPVAVSDEPDPYLYGARLACGELIDVQHPHATHHYCETHEHTVPVETVWPHDHTMYAASV